MRDLETIEAALVVAETGHLVFSTLHTNSAVQTINRVIDVFPPHQQEQVRAQLSLVLQGVISQQLLPRADGRGRCLAAEIMIPNAAIRNLIREAKVHQIYSQMQVGQQKWGMQTMSQSLFDLHTAAARSPPTRPSATRPSPRSSGPCSARRRRSSTRSVRWRATELNHRGSFLMPVFKWVGVGPNGETMRGEMEATTRQAVITRLRTQRINPSPDKIKREGQGPRPRDQPAVLRQPGEAARHRRSSPASSRP